MRLLSYSISHSILNQVSLICSFATSSMAKSKFEYVKEFEREDVCLRNCWIVIRLDGRNYSKFSDAHKFTKPNDINALELMNRAALKVMEDFNEICLAYGQSDEYSFIFRKDANVYNRRGTWFHQSKSIHQITLAFFLLSLQTHVKCEFFVFFLLCILLA